MSGNEPIVLVSFWLSWLHNGRLLVNKMVNCDHLQDLSGAHYVHEGSGGSYCPLAVSLPSNLFSGAMLYVQFLSFRPR